MQVLDALVGLGMRTQVTPGVLLAAARALDGVPDPCEDDVCRAERLLAKLDEAATQGVHHKRQIIDKRAWSGIMAGFAGIGH